MNLSNLNFKSKKVLLALGCIILIILACACSTIGLGINYFNSRSQKEETKTSESLEITVTPTATQTVEPTNTPTATPTQTVVVTKAPVVTTKAPTPVVLGGATITSPANGTTFKLGANQSAIVTFKGIVKDANGNILPESSYSWKVVNTSHPSLGTYTYSGNNFTKEYFPVQTSRSPLGKTKWTATLTSGSYTKTITFYIPEVGLGF